jgi:hypothetical protein
MLAMAGTIQMKSGWYEYEAPNGKRKCMKWAIDGGEWSQVAGPFARKEYEAARAEHERMHPTRSEGQ